MIISKIKDFYYNIKTGIKNLIYFFPVVWGYRYWDFCFDFRLMRRMYELKEKHWGVNTFYVGDIKDKEHLKVIIKCLEILEKENYSDMNPKATYKQESIYYNGIYDILTKTLKRKLRLWA